VNRATLAVGLTDSHLPFADGDTGLFGVTPIGTCTARRPSEEEEQRDDSEQERRVRARGGEMQVSWRNWSL